MKSHKQAHLGVPHYIGSGSFENGGIKYRFMVMDRFGQDVEKLFLDAGKKFPLQTVFSLGLRLVSELFTYKLDVTNSYFSKHCTSSQVKEMIYMLYSNRTMQKFM